MLFKEKRLQNMFEKSHILRATLHQHINLKQSLKIEIHKFWMSNMHKICGSQNYIEIVIINSSAYYNMFSYINLGFYQTWDEFLRELPLIHKSQIFIFLENLIFYDIFQSIQVWVILKNSYLKVLFPKSSDPKRIFTYFIHHLKVITSSSNASTIFMYFPYPITL